MRRQSPRAGTVTEHGPAWPNPALGKQPLAGFSHGVAGIAYALLELAVATGDERYRTAALAALDYERALFDAVHQNWPDLRETQTLKTETNSAQGSVFVTAWCHGAPGIGLSRLAMLRHRTIAAHARKYRRRLTRPGVLGSAIIIPCATAISAIWNCYGWPANDSMTRR